MSSTNDKNESDSSQETVDIAKTYQKKTQLEHILLRPDTYIGSTERLEKEMWVVNDSSNIVEESTEFVPGLIKIFDEIVVNAADNKQRDSSTSKLEVLHLCLYSI